jgi:hypothetical protein
MQSFPFRKWMSLVGLTFAIVSIGVAKDVVTKDPNDFGDVEDFLKQSNSDHQKTSSDQMQQVLKALTSMLSDQTTLANSYREAYIKVHFAGLPDEKEQVKQWDETFKTDSKNAVFLWGLRMHIQYLIASFVKTAGKEDEAMNLSLNWIDAFSQSIARLPDIVKQEVLTQGVNRSVFLQANHLTDLLKPGQNWYLGDLTKVGEVQRVNVIGYYRMKKDPQIFNVWDKNLKLEIDCATHAPLIVQKEDFKLQRHPWLLWQIGKDYASFGLTRQAVDSMTAAIKENPQSEFYDSICSDIRRIISDARNKAKSD